MAKQVPSSEGTSSVVGSSVGISTSCIVTPVQAPTLQLASPANPQIVVQSPGQPQQQQQVLILPAGATTIPQSQLSQITIRPQPVQQNAVQILGQASPALQSALQPVQPSNVQILPQGSSTMQVISQQSTGPVQVITQPSAGSVTVVSQGQPGSASQMFYIVSPTRTVTTAKPQGVVAGNKVLLSPSSVLPPARGIQTVPSVPQGKLLQSSQGVAQSPAIQATPAAQPQPAVILKSPQSLPSGQALQRVANTGPLIAHSAQNALSGLAAGGLQTVALSQEKLLTPNSQGVSQATSGVVTNQTANVVIGQNRAASKPVTLQLKITDAALLQKLGVGQGKVLNLSGLNLSSLLANQKVQLVGQSKNATKGSTRSGQQSVLGQGVKLTSGGTPIGISGLATGAGQTVQIAGGTPMSKPTAVVGSPLSQAMASTTSMTASTTLVTAVTHPPTTLVSTVSSSQQQHSGGLLSNQKRQQNFVVMKSQQPTLSSPKSTTVTSIVGSPQAGTKQFILQGGQKAPITGGLGASFVIGNRQISNIVPKVTQQTTGKAASTPMQKRITLSPSATSAKPIVQTTVITQPKPAPTAVKSLAFPQKSERPLSAPAKSAISAVSAELKAVSASTGPSSATPPSSGLIVTSSTAGPVKVPEAKKETVVIKKFMPSASSAASTVVSSGVLGKPASSSSTSGQSLVSKFIKIVPPKPGQKQTQMVISVNPNTDVNGEVKAISNELALLQGQPKTHDTLKKLQDLQTRLQQLQMVTQLIKKAKMNQQPATSSSKASETKERKKMIKQHKLQEKANRIVAEAVQKAKAAGKVDIPHVNDSKLPPLPDGAGAEIELESELERRKRKKDKSRSKSKKSKDSKKDKKRDREKKQHPPRKKVPKKLPAAAILKLKRQKRKRGENCSDSSDYDETPPRTPNATPDPEADLFKRRSARNTTRKKYTEDYDFKITDDESSSSGDEGKDKNDKKKKEKKQTPSIQAPPGPPRPVATARPSGEVDSTAEVDVESVEPMLATQGTQFFVENPDEDEANIIEKILSYRSKKKPPHPGEAQVGEVEEYFVKYRNFSYLHCEWQTVDKIKDPRIHLKVKRFKQKLRHMPPITVQQMEEEPFNPDFIQVDRVLDEAITNEDGTDVTHYLVKWASLPYEDSTWELSTDVEATKIDFFHKFNKVPPPEKRIRKSKARSSDWEKLSASPVFKDGNVLRDYQLEGVNWLMFSWCNGQNCILADEMGLGKTIQSLAFLTRVIKYGINGPFLVIAPLSTITNWQREFEAWTGLNAVVYHGSAQSRHMVAEFEMFHKDEDGGKIPNCYKFHVLITTYEVLLADCEELSEIEWRVVIIDEAHRLKNRNCKLLEGLKILDVEHRVLLTGTPLQNNVEELFSLLNFLEPGRFRSIVQFMDDFGDLKTEGQVERLQQLLKPMMLRRLKEDVEKNLAPKEETIVEVELTSIQKRYYRAILERNFSFLQKGANSSTNLPNLMNTMMELRKCCNHPFLINGAEDQIMLEMNSQVDQSWTEPIQLRALTQSSGKMVLLDKLLPRLKEGGHRVLIFSQMIKVLDLLEDYLLRKAYLFERIDGRIRGNLRQAAIDRFSKPDSDRFIFLLCTRAGGLGINLTAADTCIIFDSDWNPQNDLQAQARCHRIGQQKAVKIYRLITRNSYEREMFDKASLKLGLDKAVLQSMRGDKDAVSAPQPLSKTEVEDLLRKGAYGAIMEDDEASSKFCEEDIEMILKRRTKVIQIESGVKGSTFAKASFTVASDHADIKIDDPDFWQKWAKKADITIRDAKEEKIIMAPRQRKQTRRYGGNDMTELSSSDEEVAPPPKAKEEKPSKKQLQSGWTRLECFRVEKGLLTFGWGCWGEIIATTRFRRRLGEKDIEAISRTMLIYCLQYYKGDENIKSFIWDLVTPSQDGTPKDVKQHKGLSVLVPRGGRKSKKPKKEESLVPCILEFDFTNKDKNAEQLLNDNGYKNHLKRHCNKVLLRVRLLFYLRHEIIGPAMARQIEEGAPTAELNLNIPPPEGEKPIGWWDTECDKSLLIGVFKHGYEKYHRMRLDPCLCFLERCGMPRLDEMPPQSQDGDGMLNDSQLDVEAMEQYSGAPVPKHIKEEPETESPGSTRPSSPSSQNANSKKKPTSLVPSEPGKLPFPQAPDLNTRVRRLVAGFQREQKKKQLKEAKKEKKDKVKQLRMAEQLRQRELRKVEGAQKWSRREESDFYRILAAFGVEIDTATGKYNWSTFKKLAKLERKYDHRMQEFYEHYRVMCLRVCKREEEIPADYAEKPPLDFQIENISEERASKCLQRIDLLLKVRNEVLPHPELGERLQLCQKSVELPEWWEPGRHDKDLLVGVSRYGINRMESQQMMMNDQELSFKELKEKYPQMGVPPPGAFTSKPKGEGKKKKKPAKPKNAAKGQKQAGAGSQEQKEGSGVGPSGESQGGVVVASAMGNGIDMVELKKPITDMGKAEMVSPPSLLESEASIKTEPSAMEEPQSVSEKGTVLLSESGEAPMVKAEPIDSSGSIDRVESMPAMGVSTESSLYRALKQEVSDSDGSLDREQGAKTGDGTGLGSKDGAAVEKSAAEGGQGAATGGEKPAEGVGNSADGAAKPGTTEGCEEGAKEAADTKAENGEAAVTKAAKQMSEAEILYTYILRWPKDRVIVHRLEQVSTCVLKGVWPGRKHNPPPPPPPPDSTQQERPPMEHSYAGGFMGSQYMEMDEPVPMKKKKKKRKPAAAESSEPRSDSASYEVYRLLVGADSQGDGDLVKKRKRKEGAMEPGMGEHTEGGLKPPRKRKRKEKLKAIDPLTGLPVVPGELPQEEVGGEAAPAPKRRKRLKDPATLHFNEITGEEKVGIIERSTGYILPAKRVPLLKDVADWISKHPRYLIAFEWGEIVIKKGFLPPDLYDRISRVPSNQKATPVPAYQTRGASASTVIPDGAGLQSLPPGSVPLAPSLPVPTRPSVLMEQNDKLKKKLKEKVTGGAIPAPTMPGVGGIAAPPVMPSQLSGISSYLIPSSGGVYISPYLASQRIVQPPGAVVPPRNLESPGSSTVGNSTRPSLGISGGPVGARMTAGEGRTVREEEGMVGEMEEMDGERGRPDQADGGDNESDDDHGNNSDGSSSIDDNDYNMLMNSDVEGLQVSDDDDDDSSDVERVNVMEYDDSRDANDDRSRDVDDEDSRDVNEDSRDGYDAERLSDDDDDDDVEDGQDDYELVDDDDDINDEYDDEYGEQNDDVGDDDVGDDEEQGDDDDDDDGYNDTRGYHGDSDDGDGAEPFLEDDDDDDVDGSDDDDDSDDD